MTDHSLDQIVEEATSPRTRVLLAEVVSCFQVGALRASITSLWTTIVYDLLFKLTELRDIYNDRTASDILEEIERRQKEKAKNSDWELHLLTEIWKRTAILTHSEAVVLEKVQEIRHLCAHPVLTVTAEVLDPGRDICRGFILKAHEYLFSRPALVGSKVVHALLEDLEYQKDALVTDHDLQAFMEGKYLKRLPASEIPGVFRSIWKIALRDVGERATNARAINVRAVDALVEFASVACRDAIGSEPEFYGAIANDDDCWSALHALLQRRPQLFAKLSDDCRETLKRKFATEESYLGAWYLSANMEAHIAAAEAKDWIHTASSAEVKRAIAECKRIGALKQACKIVAVEYGQSGNFDQADRNFRELVRPNIALMDAEDIEQLASLADENNQTFRRGRSKADHRWLCEYAATSHPTLDLSQYTNFYVEPGSSEEQSEEEEETEEYDPFKED